MARAKIGPAAKPIVISISENPADFIHFPMLIMLSLPKLYKICIFLSPHVPKKYRGRRF
jgi:hypothetical protein